MRVYAWAQGPCRPLPGPGPLRGHRGGRHSDASDSSGRCGAEGEAGGDVGGPVDAQADAAGGDRADIDTVTAPRPPLLEGEGDGADDSGGPTVSAAFAAAPRAF
ncbi:hypothetical protein ACFU6I_43990 [Streptomyces sp. NPDC057486]|uniref:hypothetical protein n=1 Tax=Streptomyces sp. NPDC057486 TaxID=3346145 RepID=UPI00369148EC